MLFSVADSCSLLVFQCICTSLGTSSSGRAALIVLSVPQSCSLLVFQRVCVSVPLSVSVCVSVFLK